MGAESSKAGKDFEAKIEHILKEYGLNYIKSYNVRTITGKRTIDFVIITRIGKAIIEAKYRDESGQNAAHRYAAEGIFTVMYEYRLLYPNDQLIAIVNNLSILQPGKQNYIALLASIGVEVLACEKNGQPEKLLTRKLEELSGKSTQDINKKRKTKHKKI